MGRIPVSDGSDVAWGMNSRWEKMKCLAKVLLARFCVSCSNRGSGVFEGKSLPRLSCCEVVYCSKLFSLPILTCVIFCLFSQSSISYQHTILSAKMQTPRRQSGGFSRHGKYKQQSLRKPQRWAQFLLLQDHCHKSNHFQLPSHQSYPRRQRQRLGSSP